MGDMSDERRISLFKEMIETPAWREFERIQRERIRVREAIIQQPLHTVNIENVSDFQGKLMAVEGLKGAVLGLNLAVSTPYDTIQDAQKREKDDGMQ